LSLFDSFACDLIHKINRSDSLKMGSKVKLYISLTRLWNKKVDFDNLCGASKVDSIYSFASCVLPEKM
jgi:hypothetical protein